MHRIQIQTKESQLLITQINQGTKDLVSQKPSLLGGQISNVLLMTLKGTLSSPSVMRAPIAGIPFGLYIATEDAVIGVLLIQVIDGKEHIITYLRQCIIDAETRYSFIKKLYLSLFYACSKL
jgi:hypothetical protein